MSFASALMSLCCCNCLTLVQFSRTVAPEASKGPALIAFMQQNMWRRIAITCSVESLWFETRLSLTNQLETAIIEVFSPAAFKPGSAALASAYKAAVDSGDRSAAAAAAAVVGAAAAKVLHAVLGEIRRSRIRIILVLSGDPGTLALAC